MQVLSDIFPVDQGLKDIPQWAVEQYFPLDDNTRITRLVPVRDPKLANFSIFLEKRSFYGGIDLSADPEYHPWNSFTDKTGLQGEIPKSGNRMLELDILELAQGDEDLTERILKDMQNNHALLTNIPEQHLNEALGLAAKVFFRAVVSENFSPAHALRKAIFGRMHGTSATYNGLWLGNWRQQYGQAHELPEFVDLEGSLKARADNRKYAVQRAKEQLSLLAPLVR